MIELLPPKPHTIEVDAPPASNECSRMSVAGGESNIRVGSLVKTLIPRRGVMLDRAEQQCLDPEVEYICGKGLVGRVHRVAPHSIVVDFVLSGADYKAIYPGPVLASKKQQKEKKKQQQQQVGESPSVDGESESSNGDSQSNYTTVSDSSKHKNHMDTALEQQVADGEREELIDVRKTLPINYVTLLVAMLDAQRQDRIKAHFAASEFHRAAELSQEWIEEILQIEALDLTDVSYHYQRLSGEDEGIAAAGATTVLSEKPLWVRGFPPSLTTMMSTVGANLRNHLRGLRRNAARHLLSWLYVCCGMCNLQLGLGVTESATVLSCGRRATMLDPANARAYSVLISSFHCTSQLDLSQQAIHQCEAECPASNRAECDWLGSLVLLDTVYRLYNPKLRPQTTRVRIPLEVTIPQITNKPSHLGLTTLQDFQPGEVIVSEMPCVWIPLSNATITSQMAGPSAPSTGKSSRASRALSFNPLSESEEGETTSGGGLFAVYASGGADKPPLMRQPPPTTILSTGVGAMQVTGAKQYSAEVPQCANCGFVLADKNFVVGLLNENNMSEISQKYINRYPQRGTVPCRSGTQCSKNFCSTMCEEQGWISFHRVDCSEAGLLTKQHLQTLKLAGGGASTMTDAALQLFIKVTIMSFCHVENKMIEASVNYTHPSAGDFVTKELDAFLASMPIVTKLLNATSLSVPAVETTLDIMRCLGPNQLIINQAYEPLAYSVYQHCLLSHRIVNRCPVTSVLKAKPRQASWPEIARKFEARMLCLFSVMGCALSPDQRRLVGDSGAWEESTVSEHLFSIASLGSRSSFDDLESDVSSGEQAGQDGEQPKGQWPNVVVESTPGDLGKGYFTMRCPDDRGLSAKADVITSLYC